MRILPILLIALLVAASGCMDEKKGQTDDTDDRNTGDQNNTTGSPVNLTVGFTGPYPVVAAYSPATLSAPANSTVNLTFQNNDQNTALGNHNWVLEGVDGAATEVIASGQSATINFTAPPPGTYAYYCSVQGHRANGMEGTWTSTEE